MLLAAAIAGVYIASDAVQAQQTCVLDVQVREESSGEPLAGVDVTVLESVNGMQRDRLIGVTNGQGRVRGSVDHAGNIIVIAVNPGHRNGQAAVGCQPGTTQTVLVKADRGALLVGRLVDGQGKLVCSSKASIDATPVLEFPTSLFSSINGTYHAEVRESRYVIHVPAGSYKVKATIGPRAIESRPLAVEQHQETKYDIVLK